MKIEKLYALSEFVDHIWHYAGIGADKKLLLIAKYNQFLKQPLKKEMFVCDEEDTNKNTTLFEDCWFSEEQVETTLNEIIDEFEYGDVFCFVNLTGMEEDVVYNKTLDIFEANVADWHSLETLADLAEYTDGRLTLKNVEL